MYFLILFLLTLLLAATTMSDMWKLHVSMIIDVRKLTLSNDTLDPYTLTTTTIKTKHLAGVTYPLAALYNITHAEPGTRKLASMASTTTDYWMFGGFSTHNVPYYNNAGGLTGTSFIVLFDSLFLHWNRTT